MRRFARRLSRLAQLKSTNTDDVPSIVLSPSTLQTSDLLELRRRDEQIFVPLEQALAEQTTPSGGASPLPTRMAYLSVPSRILAKKRTKRSKTSKQAKKQDNLDRGKLYPLANASAQSVTEYNDGIQDDNSLSWTPTQQIVPIMDNRSVASCAEERPAAAGNYKIRKNRSQNLQMLERTSRFLSIMYALLLIIIGAMCTVLNIDQYENYIRDIFFISIASIGMAWLLFLHLDILRYKRWAVRYVKACQRIREVMCSQLDFSPSSDHENEEESEHHRHQPEQPSPLITTISSSSDFATDSSSDDECYDESYNQPYDSVSLNTAMIFDAVQESPLGHRSRPHASYDSVSMSSAFNLPEEQDDEESWREDARRKNALERGYRYFQGKHSNDFYLKTGMIVFCFGSIMHLGIGIVQQSYFFIHHDGGCQAPFKLVTYIVRTIFSFYQLFIAFKYSNIIINRYKNLARFALMHLLGTSISIWLDSITDEVIDDYVSRKFADNGTNSELNDTYLEPTIDVNDPFQKHLEHEQNCSRLAIVSNNSMSALPYLYPFTIEFNIAIASVWYMIWTNIGKVNDKSLFYSHGDKQDVPPHENRADQGNYRSTSLQLNVDCHSSNRGLFLGLAFLLVIVITIVIFFSTIKRDIYSHFSVATYSLQIAALTLCSFIVIPLAYRKLQQLDVVASEHRDNAFTIMDDILMLIPVPFYFVHYSLSIIANIFDNNEDEFERNNNILLSIIDLLTIAQVMIQSPFIVDGLRRCANNHKVRLRKPGRELIIFALILNVTLWILNTFELKSVEVYHATHHYFGEFNSMIISHSTLPIMLFYRFHSSVCLSNIWKYAYEKDE